MPKTRHDNQDLGSGGEKSFAEWASNTMHWEPTKLDPDFGIDFVCQIPGKRLSEVSSEMPGSLLCVSVRSTSRKTKAVSIDRSDAQLFWSAKVPLVLALIRHTRPGKRNEVSIRIPEESFIAQIEEFLASSRNTCAIRFADAVSCPSAIQQQVDALLDQYFPFAVQRLRIQHQLAGIIENPNVDFISTAFGSKARVKPVSPKLQLLASDREQAEFVLRDIPIDIVLMESSAIPDGVVAKSSRRESSLNAAGARSTTVEKTGATTGYSDASAMMDQIQTELVVWNYDRALEIVEPIESALAANGEQAEASCPQLLILLARVHVIRAERREPDTQYHIQQAKLQLGKADSLIPTTAADELLAEARALRGALQNLENGPDAALALLSGHTDRYAVRLRLAMLISKLDFDGGIALIDDLPKQLHWADLAVAAYVFQGNPDKGEEIVKWAREQDNTDKYRQCVVRLADALLARTLAGHAEGSIIHSSDLSDEEREGVRKVLEELGSVSDSLLAAGEIGSGLDLAAARLAWQANHLLGHREVVAHLAQLMYAHRPIPLEVARSVVSGIVEPPSDLPERLRLEHPDDFDACILALAIQSAHMGQYGDAFEHAELLVSLADTDKKREDLFLALQQIWQELDGDLLAECERIMTALVCDLPRLRMLFEAARALREGDPDKAIGLLDAEQNETDPTWLQLRANALLQKDLPGEAVEYLVSAARKTSDPVLLRGAADLAFHVQKIEIARECYEQLLKVQPDNLAVHGNLATIYAFHLHDLERTSTHLRALHDAEPENAAHTVNLAICLSQLYRPRESLSLYDEACAQDAPDIRAILGRAELHLSLGDPDAALASLRGFRETAWKEPSFLMSYMNAAYAAGDEEAAQEALVALDVLRKAGGVDPDAFRAIPADEGLAMLRQRAKQEKEQTELIHTEMNRGRAPWIWAEAILGNALYWGWRTRTQDMPWIPDDPVNRARFCIYATNAFHPRSADTEPATLMPLECPCQGTRVVTDISSLFALHRLGLLDVAAEYFGEVLVPEGYLPVVLEDSRKMVFHQRSRHSNLTRLSQAIEAVTIAVQQEGSSHDADMASADEYGELDEHRYRLVDLAEPVHRVGAINDADYKRLLHACTKPSGVDETHPELVQFQSILADLSTLETIASMGMLDAFVRFYKVAITPSARREVRQRLEAIQNQEETLSWHFDLWNQIRSDSRFTFIHPLVPDRMRAESRDEKDHLPLLGCFAAQELGIPLLADDRVCQALALNNRPDVEHPAFGTDVLVSALAASGRLDEDKAAECTRQLMQWRYRFVLPSPAMLKTLAAQYRLSPPGSALRETADYVHDCMRDAGLFGGPEKTALKDSMATRLYLTWVTTVADFLVEVWNDESFTDDSAKTLTDWAIHELLPSPPRVSQGQVRVRLSAFTSRRLISQALIVSTAFPHSERSADGVKAIKEALALTDDEYLRIVTEILDDR